MVWGEKGLLLYKEREGKREGAKEGGRVTSAGHGQAYTAIRVRLYVFLLLWPCPLHT